MRGGTIGTTEEAFLQRDPRRTSLIIQNTHATQYIWINDVKGGVENNGIRISPGGGSMAFKIPEDDPSCEWYIVADGASTTYRYYEGYGYLPETWRKV